MTDRQLTAARAALTLSALIAHLDQAHGYEPRSLEAAQAYWPGDHACQLLWLDSQTHLHAHKYGGEQDRNHPYKQPGNVC